MASAGQLAEFVVVFAGSDFAGDHFRAMGEQWEILGVETGAMDRSVGGCGAGGDAGFLEPHSHAAEWPARRAGEGV